MRNPLLTKLLCAATLLSTAGTAFAHELFLKLDSHYLQPGTQATLRLLNGTFDESAGGVPRDRMQDVTVAGGGRDSRPSAQDWRDTGKESHLTITTGTAGILVAGVSTKYTTSERRSSDEFATYLKLEGIPDLLAKYDPGAYPNGVRYRYAKHARAIMHVGDARADESARSLGYVTEIALLGNPARIKAGDIVRFKALYKGQPLAGQLVHVGHGTGKHAHTQELRTQADGTAQFPLTKAGIWYIHFNRMEKAETAGFDFESDRASLTFEVR